MKKVLEEKIKFFAVLFLSGILFFTNGQSLAAQEKTTIRVGLSNSSFSAFEFNKAALITTQDTRIIDMTSGKETKDIGADKEIGVEIENYEFKINVEGKEALTGLKGPVVVVSSGKIGIKDLNRKGNPAFYKGMIEFKQVENKNKFNIVNVLDTQTYLKGVVPNEMPVSFGLNALKAQAVAARNYANRPQNVYKNYDICDSTACQVYYGANSQTAISDRAVDETEGIFALYNQNPILALYSSTGGGITEDYDKVYGNGITVTQPALRSKKDNQSIETPKTEEELKEFYTKNIPSFDMKSPKHRWKVEFDRFELEEILNQTLQDQSKSGLVSPSFTKSGELYGLEDIAVVKRGASGKALEVEIRSMGGTWRVKKELGIRRAFKKGKSILWSGNFVVEKKNSKKYENEEKSEEEKIQIESKNEKGTQQGLEAVFQALNNDNSSPASESKNDENDENKIKKVYKNRLGIALPDTFTFFGAGFGHGVGMSQYGAGFLSANGVGYDEILKYYYSGIKLGTMDREVRYNNYNQKYVQTLYVNDLNNPNKGTAGVLPSSISQNPMKTEITELYERSKCAPKYILNINNSKKPSALEFYVNDVHFNPSMTNFNGKILKMDITKYLKTGKNTITFMPLKAQDKDIWVSFRVEIEK